MQERANSVSILSLNLRRHGKATYLRFKRRITRQDTAAYTQLHLGQPLIIVGGVRTGKTKKLLTLKAHIESNGGKVVYLDGFLNFGDMVKHYEGKNQGERQQALAADIDDQTYIIIDNAEKVKDSRKITAAVDALERCRNMVVSCNGLDYINWKLRRRLELKGAKIEHLGHGGATFDATLVIVAVVVAVIALSGAVQFLLGAAAFRYMFQGINKGWKS